MMLTVRCPQCHNSMRYESKSDFPAGNSKRCVFCNKSFVIRDNIVVGLRKTPPAEFTDAAGKKG
jgi:NAD-dependent SIR2 family protein deacetylase